MLHLFLVSNYLSRFIHCVSGKPVQNGDIVRIMDAQGTGGVVSREAHETCRQYLEREANRHLVQRYALKS
jgi:hypothetical protein